MPDQPFLHWIKYPLTTFFLLFVSNAPAFCQQPVSMFRGGADHLNTAVASAPGPLTEEAWSVSTGAPVRASVAVTKNAVLVGNAQGIFYCFNRNNGKIQWQYNTGAAIHSSAAVYKGLVYFTDNRQCLYALDEGTGKLKWKLYFPPSLSYEWGFDYYYSSPTITGNDLVIGTKAGFVYKVNAGTGAVLWKYKTEGVVRSTPAVKDGVVYFGDTEGVLYAINVEDAKEQWKFFIDGHAMKNEDFGFDRRAIISSPVVTGNKVIVGGRDGFLYAVDKETGKELWRVNHEVSWIISSVAVRDSVVVTGTSDGRFVQAVNLNSGKEIWKFRTANIVWSSPVIVDDKVYVGSNEGMLYCLDLATGKRLSFFQADGEIWSSPVLDDSLLFFGTDRGTLYAMKPSARAHPQPKIQKFVFYEPGVNGYFRTGTDVRIKEYLAQNRYKPMDGKRIISFLSQKDSAKNSVIVFATNYFPPEIMAGLERSLLRTYLENGGKIILLGINPAVYQTDPLTKSIKGFNFLKADSVLGINYGYKDLRAMSGVQPAYPTEEGKQWGLQHWWTSFLPMKPSQVDVVLGLDENGLVSAWVKKYSTIKGSGLVQVWADPDGEMDLSYILRVAEYGFDE
jgi:outer membrane protein assembly factor BamB